MNTRYVVKVELVRTCRMMARAAAVLAVALVLQSESKAQPGVAEAKQLEGRVQSLTRAPMGEVDGALIDDGTVIHWPPHLADRFAAVAVAGDRIRASGRMETGPEGDTHLEVQTVTNLRTNASAENGAGPPPPPPRPGRRVGPPPRRPLAREGLLDPRTGALKTAEGRVRSMTTAPMGEVDGAILDDGTAIHWPPHLADRFAAVVTRGERVKVSGWTETGPEGDTHLEVQTATNLRTNGVATNDDGPLGPRPVPDGSADFAPARATNDQIERRLKATRRPDRAVA